MIGGGALVLVGLVFYGAASGTQEEIDKAPVATRNDLIRLQQLESKADSQALVGNIRQRNDRRSPVPRPVHVVRVPDHDLHDRFGIGSADRVSGRLALRRVVRGLAGVQPGRLREGAVVSRRVLGRRVVRRRQVRTGRLRRHVLGSRIVRGRRLRPVVRVRRAVPVADELRQRQQHQLPARMPVRFRLLVRPARLQRLHVSRSRVSGSGIADPTTAHAIQIDRSISQRCDGTRPAEQADECSAIFAMPSG
jgi:hypothetical protein